MAASVWTLDELTQRVSAALAAASDAGAYPGAPNGRVRDVPDARAIRWYATRGLLDRPVNRGRTAGYGPRHLLQLVVIKRRQAQGWTLAAIQAELAGATDAELRALAAVPPQLLQPEPDGGNGTSAAPAVAARTRFWAVPSTPVGPSFAPSLNPVGDARAADPTAAADSIAVAERAPVADALLTGVPLAAGTVLLLPAVPTPEDVAAIRDAAQPLLAMLADRGLVTRS